MLTHYDIFGDPFGNQLACDFAPTQDEKFGQVLAGRAAREDVDGLDGRPVDRGDVAVVRDAGEAVGEDLVRALVDLGVPRDPATVDGLDAHAETAVAGEQLSDARAHFAASSRRMQSGQVTRSGRPVTSHAGRRAGMTEGTRSNLWVAMREAIAQLRPPMVVWENVGGAFSAAADSEVEPCAGCVGDGPGVHLRALGRVLGDLSSLGYDASWHALRAADIGAPHGRLRVFVVATDARHGAGHGEWARAESGQGGEAHSGMGGDLSGASPILLPSPRTSDTNGAGAHGDGGLDLRTAVNLLGTPTARMWKGSGPVGSASHDWLLDHGNVEAQVLLLPTPAVNEAQRLLPTPRALDATGVRGVTPNRSVESNHRAGETLSDIGHDARWGDYAAAIARWERIIGRPAPAPTQTSSKGNPQLAPAFVEWMMGLPAGWITDVPGITRNEALKALGNGVVPQQAAEALRVMARWAVAA